MIELIFETHATSVDNEDGLASGHWDAPLSALGEKQALERGGRYPRGTGMEVFCSDLQRSYTTAEIAFRGREEVVIRKDPRLRECDYGRLTRAPHDRVAAERAGRTDVPFPDGESYVDCTNRVSDFMCELWRGRHPRALIIGHRATQFALQHLLLDKPLADVVVESWSWRPGWTYELSGLPRSQREAQ